MLKKIFFTFILFCILIQFAVAGDDGFDWTNIKTVNGNPSECIVKYDDGSLSGKAEFKNGKITATYITYEGPELFLENTYEYNSKGLLIVETFYWDGLISFKTEYIYNNNNQVKEMKYYGYEMDVETFQGTITYEYDSSNNLVKSIYKDREGIMYNKTIYTNNSKGKVINELIYGYWEVETGIEEMIFEYEYNDREEMVQMKMEDYIWEYSFLKHFKYDSKGNLIKVSVAEVETPNEPYIEYTVEYKY